LHSALTPLIRFIARNLVLLLAIAIVIAAARFAHREWTQLQAARANAAMLARSVDEAGRYQQTESAALASRVAHLHGKPITALDSRIADIRQALQSTPPVQQSNLLPLLANRGASGVGVGEGVAAYYKRQLAAEALRQELAYLERLRATLSAVFERDAAIARLADLRTAHETVYAQYLQNKRLRDGLNWIDAQLIDYPLFQDARLAALETEHQRLLLANRQAGESVQVQQNALAQLAKAARFQAFTVDQGRMDAVIAPLRQALAHTQTSMAANWVWRLATPIRDALPLAALVLLSTFIGHLLVKALFYYVLAPLAARRKPIRLDHVASGQIVLRGDVQRPVDPRMIRSAVSQAVMLAKGEEMLVLADYVQSASVHGKKDTKWLLDWAYPWTSLISGLYALTRIRTTGADERVVLSASADALSELALITIPAGSAMVFQPRGMVGVIYDAATPLAITRHWRLGTLHAWLTLQLRYLVFHGPVTLIVSGTRGVRVERAGDGRTISQASTLGFSANVDYSTVRCETFFPFYMSKTALLQDRFAGEGGYYVYDETPRGGKKAGFVERGLEGVVDGVLKVFGI